MPEGESVISFGMKRGQKCKKRRDKKVFIAERSKKGGGPLI
jgi:hypothetical protein